MPSGEAAGLLHGGVAGAEVLQARTQRWEVLLRSGEDAELALVLAQPIAPGVSDEVDVLTDGAAADEMDVTGAMMGPGAPALWWSTADLVVGPTTGMTLGTSLVLHMRSYLQMVGIHGGTNTLGFAIWHFGHHVLRSAELLKGSRIIQIGLGPARLTYSARLSAEEARMGQLLNLHYRLRSTGLPARDVGIMITLDHPGVAAIDPPSHYFAWVANRQGNIRLRLLRQGLTHIRVEIRADTGSGVPWYLAKVLSVRVDLPRALRG